MDSKQLTEQELMAKLAALGDISEEQRNSITCSLIGHSKIQTFCFGYFNCARCGAQLGDSLGGYYPQARRGCEVTEDCFASCERFIDAVSTIDELRRELATAQRELTEMTEEHDEARVAFADHGFDDDGKTLPELVECMNHAVGYAVDLASVAEKQRDKAWADMKRRGLVLMTTQPASDHATFAMVMICHKSQNKAFCDREAEPNPRTVGGLMWDCPNCDGPKTGSVTAIPFSPCMPSEVGAKLETLTAERGEAIKQRDEAIKQRDEAQAIPRCNSRMCAPLSEVQAAQIDAESERDALAAQVATMREKMEGIRDELKEDLCGAHFSEECSCEGQEIPRDDWCGPGRMFDAVKQALSTPPTPTEQTWQAMRDVAKAAKVAVSLTPSDGGFGNGMYNLRKAVDALAKLDALKGGDAP